METIVSNPIDKLAEALAKAQSEIKAPVKDRHVDFQPLGKARVKYSYADLANVLDAVREPLSKNGLSVLHVLTYSGDMYGLKTSLMHSSGQFIESWYPLPDPGKQQIRAQEFGSALTYARRYSLCSIVGIAADEDDDGQLAAPTHPPVKPPPVKVQVKQKDPDDIDAALNQTPMTNLEKLYALVDERGWPPEVVKEKMKLCLGFIKPSKELSDAELVALLKYINLSGPVG